MFLDDVVLKPYKVTRHKLTNGDGGMLPAISLKTLIQNVCKIAQSEKRQ
jgi:hypothetical protein